MAQYRTMSRKVQEPAAEKQARASEAEARFQAEREAHSRVEEQLQEEKEARAQAEERAQAEALLKAEFAAQVQAEAEAREMVEARLQAETDARERAVAEARKEAEVELRQVVSQAQMEQQAHNEAQARLKAEEEARARAEAEALAQAEAREVAEAAAKEEAEARLKAETEMAEKLTRAEDRYEALASENKICSTALAGAEARAHDASRQRQKAEDNRVKEAKAKEEAEAQARQEAESRAQAETRAAEETKARAEAEARAEREAAARSLAEEKVAVEAAARNLAEKKVAAEAEARTRALNRQLELEARALATQSALLEAEARVNSQAKAAEEAEARANTQAKAAEEAEARANAQAKAAEEAEARANAQAKATQEAQMYATAESQAAAAARAEVERLTQERARADDGGALDARRDEKQGIATPGAAASPDKKMRPLEGKLKNVRRGWSTSDVVALSPGPHVHTLKNPTGAAGVCRRALPQVDVMPDAEQKEGDTHTHSQTSPRESEGGVSVFEKSPRRSPLDGSPRRAEVADAASSPVHFDTGALASTPSAYTVDRSMVSSPSLSRGALIPETSTADLQPGSPSSYASSLLPPVDTPLQNLEESWMMSPSTVCTTQVFEADGISKSEPGVTLTPGLASQHDDSADQLPKASPKDALCSTENVSNGADKPRTHDNDRLFRIIVEMNRKMNLMSEELSEVRARNDARDGAHTMEVDALVAQLLPLSSQVESLSRKCESMEVRLAQTEAQSRRIFEAREGNSTENAAAAQKKKKAAAPGRLTPRIEALEKSVTALQNQADTLSSQHVKSTGRAGQWQRQAARGIGALESRVAGAARAVEDTQALAFALAERLASVEAKNEERNASHAPLKEEMRAAGGGAARSGSIDAKSSDSIFIFSTEKEESQAGAAEGLTTPPGSPPQTIPQEADGPETQEPIDLGSAAQGHSETEETAPSPEAKQAVPKERSVEDFLPALVHCQGLSHQLRQLESAVEASAVAQRRLEEHVEAAAVVADAGSGSENAREGESAAELEALGYESRVGRGAVLQATQAARRECVRMTSTIETEVLKRLDGSKPLAQPRKGGAVASGEGRAKKDFFSCHASAERALDQEAVLRNLRRNSPEARRWNSSTSTNARHKSKHGWKKQAFKAVGISM